MNKKINLDLSRFTNVVNKLLSYIIYCSNVFIYYNKLILQIIDCVKLKIRACFYPENE